jgi:hypothetical protein
MATRDGEKPPYSRSPLSSIPSHNQTSCGISTHGVVNVVGTSYDVKWQSPRHDVLFRGGNHPYYGPIECAVYIK